MRFELNPEDLARIRARLRPTPVNLDDLASFARGQIGERVKTQGASGGVKWEPLKETGGPALVNAEREFETGVSGKGSTLAAVVETRHKGIFYNHFGTEHIPARPILPTSPAEQQAQARELARLMRENP